MMEEGIIADYSDACRLCLVQYGKKLPIFGTLDEDLGTLSARIQACLSFEVLENDELPKQICQRCISHINVWHYFKLECDSAQIKLKKWCGSLIPGASYVADSSNSRRVALHNQVINIKLEPEEELIDALDCSIEENVDDLIPLGTPSRNRKDYCHDNTNKLPQRKDTEADPVNESEVDSENQFNSTSEAVPISAQSDLMDLVIIGTTSVVSESTLIQSSASLLEPVEALLAEEEDLLRLVVEEDDEEDGGTEDEGGITKNVEEDQVDMEGMQEDDLDVTFISEGAPSHQILEVTIEDSHDGTALPSSRDINEDMSLRQEEQFSLMDNPPEADSVAETSAERFVVKKEIDADHWSCWKIKQEPEDSDTSQVQLIPRRMRPRSCALRTSPRSPVSQSPVTHTTPTKLRGPSSLSTPSMVNSADSSSSPTTNDHNSENISNFSAIKLPKITNEFYDERSCLCKICDKAFTNRSFWRHMRTHKKENPFRCNVCRKVYPGRRELVAHRIRTVSKYCRQGEKPADDLSLVLTFNDVPRGKLGRYRCRDCGDKFGQLSSVLAHIRVHTGEKPFFCYKCNNREFRLQKSAMKHVHICKGYLKGPVILKGKVKCLPEKISKPVLGDSENSQPRDKKRNCTKCKKVFPTSVGLSNHLRSRCVGLSKCPSCSKMFSSCTLKRHFKLCQKGRKEANISSKSVMPNLDNPSSSIIASTTSSSASGAISPVKKKPGKISKIVNMSVKDLLAMHLNRDGKLSTMTCKLCNNVLGSRKSLLSHLAKHSAKVFKCHVCNLRMSQKATYEAHMATYHEGFVKAAEKLDSSLDPALTDAKGMKPKPKFSSFASLKLKCEICFKLFSSLSALKYHKLSHKKVKCEVCEITFPATMKKAHICTPKVKTVSQPMEMNQDKQESEVPQVRSEPASEASAVQYTCQLCKKRFHTRKMLYQHKKMHIKVKIYKCKMCGNSYSDAGALQRHKESEHASEMAAMSDIPPAEVGQPTPDVNTAKKESKEWNCPKCQKQYSTRDSLNRHMKLHSAKSKTQSPEKPYQPEFLCCNLCNKIFSNEKSFARHKELLHSTVSQEIPSPDRLMEPEAESSLSTSPSTSTSATTSAPTSLSTSEQTFDCEICGKKFGFLKNLKCHMSHHKKEMSPMASKSPVGSLSPIVSLQNILPRDKSIHKCKFCSKAFLELSSYKNHIKTHQVRSSMDVSQTSSKLSDSWTDEPEEKPEVGALTCKLCNKEYKSRKGLKHHILNHSGEKPFKCKSCSNQYSTLKSLNRHETEMHINTLRPFSCNRCKTSFIQKEDLIAHYEKCTH